MCVLSFAVVILIIVLKTLRSLSSSAIANVDDMLARIRSGRTEPLEMRVVVEHGCLKIRGRPPWLYP